MCVVLSFPSPLLSVAPVAFGRPVVRPSAPRDSVHIPGKIGWPFEDKVVEEQRPKLTWIGGAKKVVQDERHAVAKFVGNPNNAFVSQGIVALVFGGLHLAKYDEFVGRLAEPLCKLVGLDWAVGSVGPHMK